MVRPYDLTKIRRTVSKSLGVADGFHDPKIWVDTGNYALNKMISGDFKRGIPLGKVTVFSGESGSGKSLICCGSVVKSCQKAGILPVILDSEYAIDKEWIEGFDVLVNDTSVMRWPVSLVDDCAKIVAEFMADYIAQFASIPMEERQPVLFIIDSLGMLSTPTDVEQFESANMKGDMGRKARQLKAFVTQCLKIMGPHNVGLLATNHIYKSQNIYAPDDVISGGVGFIFASSIVVGLNKSKLKEDEDGKKISEVNGIVAKAKCIKSRYAKPFEEIELKIPYSSGLSPYSGLFDMAKSKNKIKQEGSYYTYIDRNGEVYKRYRKDYDETLLDIIMDEWDDDDEPLGVGTELEAE